MRRKRQRTFAEAEMPMSSMIDVVFLLLIYFVFTQKPIIEDTLFGVNFQQNTQKVQSNQTPSTILCFEIKNNTETSKDEFYLNKHHYKFQEITQILNDTVKYDKDIFIVIKCGENSKHSNLIRFLDFCQSASISKITLSE